MTRCMIYVYGTDRPNALSNLLQCLSGYRVEAAWVRSFGTRSGAVLLMIQANPSEDSDLLAFTESMNRICDDFNDTEIKSHGPENCMGARPIFIDGHTPYWEQSCDGTPVPHIIFSIEHPTNNALDTEVYNHLDGLRDNIQIAQHDSLLCDDNMKTLRIFRAYGKSDWATISKAEFRDRISGQLGYLANNNNNDIKIEFKIPSSREIAYLNRPEDDIPYLTIQACLRDRLGLYTDLYQFVSQITERPVMRSCCRGLGGVGVLCYAVALPADLHDNNQRENAIRDWENQLQNEYTNDCLPALQGHSFRIKQDPVHPHHFAGGPYEAALVSRFGFSKDQNGSLFAITKKLQNEDIQKGNASIYMLDAQPSPSNPKRFTARIATLYSKKSDMLLSAGNVNNDVFVAEKMPCDTIDLFQKRMLDD